jgi:hypothetical protein
MQHLGGEPADGPLVLRRPVHLGAGGEGRNVARPTNDVRLTRRLQRSPVAAHPKLEHLNK